MSRWTGGPGHIYVDNFESDGISEDSIVNPAFTHRSGLRGNGIQ